MTYSQEEIAGFVRLYGLNIIPLRVILASLTWVLYDYFDTLADEVRFIWPQKRGFAKYSYLFVRYYTVLLLVFDVVQIHSFAIPGVPTNAVCVAIDPVVRLAGAISLWAIEIIMQVRVYALYSCSKKVAIFNAVVFSASVVAFMGIMIPNAMKRGELIATAVRLPLPGCPVINGGTGWALWIPATGMEIMLFGFVLYRGVQSLSLKFALKERVTLHEVLIGDNILYFFGITVLLIFNNLMAAGALNLVPWFSYGPFHGAMGIMTNRMLIHLRKLSVRTEVFGELPFSMLVPDDEMEVESPMYAVPGSQVISSRTMSTGRPVTLLASIGLCRSSVVNPEVDLERCGGT